MIEPDSRDSNDDPNNADRNDEPRFLHPAAWQLFKSELGNLEEPESFVKIATALGMHEHPDLSIREVEDIFERHAMMINARVQSEDPRARLAHLHEYFFDELGFHGDTTDYYHPRNSYLHRVLQTRRGLPITLCLVYREIARRVGVTVHGIGAPGHFLAEIQIDEQNTLIDVFDRGRMLTPEEARERSQSATGQILPQVQALFPKVSHRVWLHRMILNLQNAFGRMGREQDILAMEEFKNLLGVTEE